MGLGQTSNPAICQLVRGEKREGGDPQRVYVSKKIFSGKLRVGTRGSRLALLQARQVIRQLQLRWPNLRCEECVRESLGDVFQGVSMVNLYAERGGGIFNSTLEKALLAGEIELVVASCKDIESSSAEQLEWCLVSEREDVRDVLVSKHGGLEDLPQGACLGTSSLRRQSQLCSWRRDLSFKAWRGNVDTRVEQALREGSNGADLVDGVILAAAGVHRLGLNDKISSYIGLEILLPSPAQGALACQYLKGRSDIANLLAPLRQPILERCVLTERRLLTNLSGGCFAPVGALARMENKKLHLRGRVTSLEGSQTAFAHGWQEPHNWQQLADEVAEQLCRQNALGILEAARKELAENM